MACGPRGGGGGGGGTFLGVCLLYFSCASVSPVLLLFLVFPVSPACFCASTPPGPSFVLFPSFCACLLIFVTVSVLLGVGVSISLFFLDTSELPSSTCRHLCCRERNLALFLKLPRGPPGFCQPEVARRRRPPESAAPVSGSCPFRGRGSLWGGSGLELGQESTGCIRTSSRPGRRPLLRAGGRAGGQASRRGLCNAEVTEVGHARLGNHPASVCGGRKGGLAPRCPVTHCHCFLSHDPWLK